VSGPVRYLADVSAIIALTRPDVGEAFGRLCMAGLVGTCGVVDLDLGVCLRDLAGLERVVELRRHAFVWLATEDQDLRRAMQVQQLVAADGQRVARWSTLVIAAVAERHLVQVLHNDPAFNVIGKATGQATQWVVPDGPG
jgi:predicted nucleic acid-binding protein